MKFTLGQAAREVGKSKTSINRYIQSGKLSGERQDDGSYQIEASELFRVFPRVEPLPEPQGGAPRDPNVTPGVTPGISNDTKALSTEIDLLRERLSDKDDVIADLRRRLDRETEERMRLTALLTDQAQCDRRWDFGHEKEQSENDC